MLEQGFCPDYASYGEEELAADEFFQKWVLMPDDENNRFWQAFREKHPERAITLDNARKLVKHLVETGFHIPFLTADEKQALKSRIFEMIGQQEKLPRNPPDGTSGKKWGLPVAALVLGIAAFFTVTMRKNNVQAPATVQTSTGIKQVKEIFLPDGSVVVLNGNSSVSYDEAFGAENSRVIYLKGNAYFRVKKQSGKPFIVHTPEAAITVTGTEFNVNARTAETNVVLTQGSVDIALSGTDNHEAIGLREPGATLSYNAEMKELTTGNIRADLYTNAWDGEEWHFDNTPLTTVIDLVEQFYGTSIVLENKALNQLTISAVVSVKDYSTLLRVIEKTLNVSVTESRDQVFIN